MHQVGHFALVLVVRQPASGDAQRGRDTRGIDRTLGSSDLGVKASTDLGPLRRMRAGRRRDGVDPRPPAAPEVPLTSNLHSHGPGTELRGVSFVGGV